MITGFFVITVLSIFLGKFVYKFTSDILWSSFSGLSLISLYTLWVILNNNYYVAFLTTFIATTLLAALFIMFKLDYRKMIADFYGPSNSYFDGLKLNTTGNSSLFFWAMFLASALCIFALLVSKKIYNKMKLTAGKMGETGETGERGESGDNSAFLRSHNQIAYVNVIKTINEEIEEFKKKSVPPINYVPDDIHLKNIFIMEEIKRICYSHEFNKTFMEATVKYRGLKGANRKCDSENRGLNYTTEMVKRDARKWTRYILRYNKGLQYLESSFRMKDDWKVLYITKDKMKGLKPNPLTAFEEGLFKDSNGINTWNWGLSGKLPC